MATNAKSFFSCFLVFSRALVCPCALVQLKQHREIQESEEKGDKEGGGSEGPFVDLVDRCHSMFCGCIEMKKSCEERAAWTSRDYD